MPRKSQKPSVVEPEDKIEAGSDAPVSITPEPATPEAQPEPEAATPFYKVNTVIGMGVIRN